MSISLDLLLFKHFVAYNEADNRQRHIVKCNKLKGSLRGDERSLISLHDTIKLSTIVYAYCVVCFDLFVVVSRSVVHPLSACTAPVVIPGGPKKRGHSTFSQISRKLLKISK